MVEEKLNVIDGDGVNETVEAVLTADTAARINLPSSTAAEPPVGTPGKAEDPLGHEVEVSQIDTETQLSPVFLELADVKLPELKRDNRARLQMQSPTRLYLYWAIRENPWANLSNIFGDGLGNYSLVLKLTDVTSGAEKVHPCEAEGSWWFDVEADREYEAEIGFHSVSRPSFRILNSNRVATPRRTPSPRAATEANWMVSAGQFAKVLDAAGFSRDAFDVVMAGDDIGLAASSSEKAFSDFLGDGEFMLGGIAADEIRFALLSLAAGTQLDELRERVSPSLFDLLEQNSERVDAKRAMDALTEHFDLDEEVVEEYETGPAVYGASLVSFPRSLKTRTVSPKDSRRLNPVSSFSLR